ncbi:regulator of nonsense transcripts UPF3-like [Magnolia sinica]|uniref:regulator of nonsense transcripts UPF3-like n=1 Tax=Magnolia sinica TaxID=86752 RepID=UPI002657DD8B|nr:regulator of nonsense transcripts UPF3-like [Magnolia sinica]XP_058097669.1 regulator of nonsense transcripts UPF3-like [Magnolia sinica]XP_058097670.1 regulator of nonsense transcripts UPF3-like [Magnolia sinica]
MKDPFDRTKVVVRHLPPAIPQSALMEQIDSRFAGRYKWLCFRPGKNSQKNQQHSRVYIDFKRPEDVVEFAEFFDGHVFVIEKGTQFKTIVEYAPSQRTPKAWSKKDGREGTIFKDPEYLEFLDLIAKPAENLPSAEIQLERREAERAGGPKDTLIVTPLMDFVRQKRAAKSGSQRPSSNGKITRKAGGVSSSNSSSASTKRATERRRGPTSMYVLRDSMKNVGGKEKSTYVLVSRRDEHQLTEKSIALGAATGAEILEDESVPGTDGATSGLCGTIETGKRRLPLKGKEREVSQASGVVSPVRSSSGFRQNQRREGSGRMIRSISINKEARQHQSSSLAVQSEQQALNLEKDKRPPRPNIIRSVLKDYIGSIGPPAGLSDTDTKRTVDDKVVGNDLHSFVPTNEKQDRRMRNKDRPDRGVWTPMRRSDGSHASDESLSSSSSLPVQFLSDSLEGMSKLGDDVAEDTDISSTSSFTSAKSRNVDVGFHNSRLGRGSNSSSTYDFPLNHGEMKVDILSASKSGEIRTHGSSRSSPIENGSNHRFVGRRGPAAHSPKEVDGSLNLSEGKPPKRGGATGYGSHEKQVWVQKSGSGS